MRFNFPELVPAEGLEPTRSCDHWILSRSFAFGRKFWCSAGGQDLRSDLSDCAEEAKNGSDPDVKAWAAKAFEVMRKQLLTVMDIRSKLK